MWQVVAMRVLRTYAPYITLPFAAAIGYIGYNFENFVSDKYTPFNESIKESRSERLIADEQLDSATSVEALKYSANVLGKMYRLLFNNPPQHLKRTCSTFN